MFATKFVFFAAALFVVQVSADTNSQWENFQKAFNDMIQKSENAANEVSSHIQQWAQEEQKKIEAMRDNLSNKISEGMAKFQEKAGEVGADVGECSKELPEDGKAVAKSLTMGAVKCVTDEVDEAKEIISSLREMAKDANATWAEASENWEECKSQSGMKLAFCRAKVAARTAMKESQYSMQVGVQVAKGAKLVSTARQTMEACAAADMAAAAINVGKVITKFGQCVMSKITEN